MKHLRGKSKGFGDKLILTSIRDKSFLHQLSNFHPPPASPKIAGAILGEVQVGVIGIACRVLILSRTYVILHQNKPQGAISQSATQPQI
jgi:hypothetical protein